MTRRKRCMKKYTDGVFAIIFSHTFILNVLMFYQDFLWILSCVDEYIKTSLQLIYKIYDIYNNLISCHISIIKCPFYCTFYTQEKELYLLNTLHQTRNHILMLS